MKETDHHFGGSKVSWAVDVCLELHVTAAAALYHRVYTVCSENSNIVQFGEMIGISKVPVEILRLNVWQLFPSAKVARSS